MNSDFAIDVRGVTKKFGDRTVVNDIAMQVRPGEIYGFLGPNGSGKTTFLRMLCGLLKPDAGSGQCLGLDFRRESPEIKKRVGYMTQRFSFYEDLTIEENLDFIAQALRHSAAQGRRGKKPRTARHGRAAPAARRHAFRRLETAAGAVRLPDSRAATAFAGRADGGRGPEGAPRFLGGNSPTCRRRIDRAGHDALHGRGGALPPAGLHRLWKSACQRHGRTRSCKPPG